MSNPPQTFRPSATLTVIILFGFSANTPPSNLPQHSLSCSAYSAQTSFCSVHSDRLFSVVAQCRPLLRILFDLLLKRKEFPFLSLLRLANAYLTTSFSCCSREGRGRSFGFVAYSVGDKGLMFGYSWVCLYSSLLSFIYILNGNQ
jgi:hypothetical protein